MFHCVLSPSSVFLLCLLFFLLHSPPVAAEVWFCGNRNYTAKSTYETNLDILLPSLTSKDSLSGGYSSNQIGQPPNETYGLALCRGDVNATVCRSCLDTASHAFVRFCPYAIEALVWYDLCLIRYSNQWSLATTPESESIIMRNINNITTDRPLFEKLVSELLSAIIDWAAYNTTNKFATGEVNFTTDLQTIYGLVQCTPDLWADPCRKCLQDIVEPPPLFLQGKQGGGVVQVKCNYRYEVYKFYDGASMVKLGSRTPAPAPLVLPPVHPGIGSRTPAPTTLVPLPVHPGRGTRSLLARIRRASCDNSSLTQRRG